MIPISRTGPPAAATHMLLDPGMDLTLRPMRYPGFYDRFRDAIKNTWTVEQVDLHSDLFDEAMAVQVRAMIAEAVDCETQFAEDLLGHGVAGLSLADMRSYLEHVADRRLSQLGLDPAYGSANPLTFMDLQDVQELSNFFE